MNAESGCKLRHLSERLVTAQRPIRVLDAVRWPADTEAKFFAAGGRDLPRVPRDCYRTLPFDPCSKLDELTAIERAARRIGGPAAEMLARRCGDYRRAVRLLQCRGTTAFGPMSLAIYGHPSDRENRQICGTLAALEHILPHEPNDVSLSAEDAKRDFATRLARSLPAWAATRVKLADTIPANAAAGCTYIKLRRGATFTPAALDLLEVHEGWVHVGTTINGRVQPVSTFLAKAPPSTSCTQEGLAVLCELLAGVCHLGRIRRLKLRYDAVRAAAAGADFRDVYRSLMAATGDERASYQQSARVFRGCPSDRGPFAKDYSYMLGLVRLLRAVQDRQSPLDLVAMFAGKLSLAERPFLDAAFVEGSVAPPAFVPPPVACPATLARQLATLPHVGHRRAAPHRIGVTSPMPSTSARLSFSADSDAMI